MIKLGQLIDKTTLGEQFLITSKNEIINQTITDCKHIIVCEVLEFDEDNNPIRFIESKEIELDFDNLNGKTMRERLTELAGI